MSLRIFVAIAALIATSWVNAGVIVGDREWRQVADTTGLSGEQLDVIYDISDGQLDTGVTTIGSLDFAGWTWASVDDVIALWVAAGIPIACPPDCVLRETGSTWAPAFLDNDGSAGPDEGLFDATFFLPNQSASIRGWSRTPAFFQGNLVSYGAPVVADLLGASGAAAQDAAIAPNGFPFNSSGQTIGVWLYRDVAPGPGTGGEAPIAPPIALLFLGLVGMLLQRR